MAQETVISRTPTDLGNLVHEHYVNKIKPHIAHVAPMAGVFSSLGDGGYQYTGTKIVFYGDVGQAGGWIGGNGYLGDHMEYAPIKFETTPTRITVRRAVDNLMTSIGVNPGSVENFLDRITAQGWEAIKLGTTRHIHGSSAATVCKVVSRTSATVLVVDAGYNHAGAAPTMHLDKGMTLALHDASAAFVVLGAAKVSSIAHNTSATTATITFATAIDDGGTVAAAGDLLAMASTIFTPAGTPAANFYSERNLAPLGLLDIIDPLAANSSYLGVAEATEPRTKPIRRASQGATDHIEIMEFLAEIAAKSRSMVSTDSHILTMQEGIKLEIAKGLIPFQQQQQLGRDLEGGWKAARIANFDLLSDMYHVPDVVYAVCPDDLHVVAIDGEPNIWGGDGSQYSRIADYDGKEWYWRWAGNRFASRRNRLGALTGVSNPNKQRYDARPAA